MNPKDIAFLAGTVTMLVTVVVYMIIMMTSDLNPVERRARHGAILAGVLAGAAVIGCQVALYVYVSEVAGSFMIAPSIGLAGIAIWHSVRLTYRRLRGGLVNGNSITAKDQS